ncbi:MAG: hypothetical protein J2P37_08640 [Ktedonobacteraceae bacterium]|nr:hypothetical protein [Ktedonobacteraceae bacterium]MBO0791519.1 hypothetical protein [Ktedonobacteraceae bacterium]
MSGPLLAGGVVLVAIVLALVGVGIYNIRSGIKALPRAEELGQEPVWHKQPNILLGFTNIIFALLVGLAALLGAFPDLRLLWFILLGLLLLLSIFLVARTIRAASAAARKLRQKAKNKTV